MLTFLIHLATSIHSDTSWLSKIVVVAGNLSSVTLLVAQNEGSGYIFAITSIASAIYLLAKSYALIKKTNFETREEEEEDDRKDED